MARKVVFWKIKKREAGAYFVEFWTKPDKSNALVTRMVTIEESKLRYNIELQTGFKHFELQQMKD
jgi:hypothetical protein